MSKKKLICDTEFGKDITEFKKDKLKGQLKLAFYILVLLGVILFSVIKYS